MGVVSISHGGRFFQFRVDPDSVNWSYNLNTKIDETYGGRVVQILSVRLGDLVVAASAGRGGWDYFERLAQFCRDVIFDQKATGEPASFSYPTKGWEMKVYLSNIPYSDEVGNTHFPFRLRFKIQEDVSGVISSDSISSELDRVRDGIGYERNDYNYPSERTESESGEEFDEDDPMPTSIETPTGNEVSINSPNRGGM